LEPVALMIKKKIEDQAFLLKNLNFNKKKIKENIKWTFNTLILTIKHILLGLKPKIKPNKKIIELSSTICSSNLSTEGMGCTFRQDVLNGRLAKTKSICISNLTSK
jgi:hypothetical protein